MGLRTDLAVESANFYQTQNSTLCDGISATEFEKAECKVTEVLVENSHASKQIGKPIGRYITIEALNSTGLDAYPEYFEEQVALLAEELNFLIKSNGDVLVVGLGNDDITPDALGPLVAKQIFATRHIPIQLPDFDEFLDLRSVAVLSPGVLGQTGIEVADIIKSVCQKIKPSLVIVIDALACSEISRLGRTIQLSNTGISPGSGVKNSRKELSQDTLGTAVISLGVPTVVDMHTIAEAVSSNELSGDKFKDIMVTPKNIDKLIEHSAKLIAMGINKALQPSMTIEDFTSLV